MAKEPRRLDLAGLKPSKVFTARLEILDSTDESFRSDRLGLVHPVRFLVSKISCHPPFETSLHNGTTSIGIVMHITSSNEKKSKLKEDGSKMSLTEHYLDQLQHVPGIQDLIGDNGEYIPGSTHSASDYSYYAKKISGDHYRIIGDAASELFFNSSREW